MISIITCSIKPDLLQSLEISIRDTISVPYEVIAIDNRNGHHSICSAYNEAARKAVYPFLCFVHEDIVFHTYNWGQKLIALLSDKSTSLVGVLGCSIKTKTPSGVYTDIANLNRINQLQRFPDGTHQHYYQNPYKETTSPVSVLDGIFLACTKANWERYPFDETGLKKFHGYDVDFSLGQQRNGKVIVTYDILIEHFSFGGNTKEWIDAQLYVSKKWSHLLPYVTELKATSQTIRAAEIENSNQFALSLFRNNYRYFLSLKYVCKIIANRPFQRLNRFFIKSIFLGALKNTK